MRSDRPRPRSKPAAKARRPGRPRGATPDQRERLLDIAIALFAREGIAAASLRGIAREAGVTPALVNYYFGSKERLRDAVIEERLLPLIGGLRERLLQAGDDIAALITGFILGVHAIFAQHPWLPALWVREILSEGGSLRDLMVERVSPLLPQMLAERFTAAQRRGELNPDLDPRLLVVSLMGLTFFPFAAAPIWRRVFASTDLGNEALRLHTFALLDRGLDLPKPVPLRTPS